MLLKDKKRNGSVGPLQMGVIVIQLHTADATLIN